jgi:thiol-disulfide isomerase/thioredoxin
VILPPEARACYDEQVTKLYRRPWLPATLLVGVLAAAGCSRNATTSSQPGETPAEETGGATLQLLEQPMDVEPFTLTDLDGNAISFADLRGKVVLVNFWATWCPPCRAEIPDLIKLQERYRDKLVVLGISEDEVGPDEVKAFVTEQKINYPIAMSTPEMSQIFKGVSALPTTFVIDRDGKVQMRHVGMLDPANTELEAQYLSGTLTNVKIERVQDETTALLARAAQAKEIPGVDLTKMTPEQRTEALKALNADNCTCGCGLTLAACRINDPACEVSLPIAKKIVEQIAKGAKPS